MKKFIVLLALLVGSVGAAAQAPTMVPGDVIVFDYFDAVYSEYQVQRFEVRWDTQATWTTINSAPFRDAATQAGASSYSVSPPFSSGNHTVHVRACNISGCGASSDPFTFAFAVSSVPVNAPSNIRIKRAGQ